MRPIQLQTQIKPKQPRLQSHRFVHPLTRVGFNPQPEPPGRPSRGFIHPLTKVGFNPQPEPPGKGFGSESKSPSIITSMIAALAVAGLVGRFFAAKDPGWGDIFGAEPWVKNGFQWYNFMALPIDVAYWILFIPIYGIYKTAT